MEFMDHLYSLLIPYVGRIIVAAVIWYVGVRLIKLVLKLVEMRLSKTRVDQSLHSFLSPLIKMVLQILLVLTVAATLGIEVTTFTAIIGAASLAVGLAFQGSLANFAGGVLILALKPFKVGDFIEVKGFSGTVKEIQVFYTILQTPDHQKVIIPNSDLSNSSAINYSAYENRRASMKFTISFDSDVQKAKAAILQVAENQPLVLKDPAPQVVVGGYGDDGLIIFARLWAKRQDYWAMNFAVLEQVKMALDEAGVEIPYKQMDVHVKN